MAGILGGASGALGGAASGAAPTGGFGVGDAGTAWGGGFERMAGGQSPYEVPGGGVDTSAEGGDGGILELMASMQGQGRPQGRDWGGFGTQAGQGAAMGLGGLMGMAGRGQARSDNARQAYRQGLLGGR